MTEHFSTLQNITEQIINSTLVLHFFSTWENNLKNFLQKSSFVQFKDHSVHNFHEVLKNFSATLTSRKKVHKTGLKMLFKCSELCSVSWKSSWQRHVANWKFVVIIIMAKLSKVRLRDFWRKIDLLGIFTPKLQIWNFENWHFWLGFAITWFQTFRN